MFKRLLAASAAAMMLAAMTPVHADPIKIGVVNMERILRDAKVAKVASDRLNEEGRQRQEEIELITKRFKQRLERFEKDSPSMSDEARLAERRALAETERDIARRNREARDEFNQRRNEEVMLLQGRAARVIQDIAKKDKLDLVLYEYFYASDRVDLTQRVIDALDKDAGKK